MRIILVLVVSLIIFSCSSQNVRNKTTIVEGRKVREFKLRDSLIVVAPRNWHKVFNHNYEGYTPLAGEGGYYHNGLKVFYWDEANISMELEELVKSRFEGTNKHKNINLTKQEILIDTTRYGKTYTYEYRSKSNGNVRIVMNKFFKHKGKLFHFYSGSDLEYYNAYKEEHDFIFNNLKFID